MPDDLCGCPFRKKERGGLLQRVLSGRPQTGPHRHRHERGSLRHEQLAAQGLPGLAYISGIAEPGWTAIGLAVGTYLNWLIVAKRLRSYSVTVKAVTIPSFFSRRYRDERNVLSCIAALVVLIFFVPYTGLWLQGHRHPLQRLFGVDYHIAMVVGAVVIIVYTVLGGSWLWPTTT